MTDDETTNTIKRWILTLENDVENKQLSMENRYRAFVGIGCLNSVLSVYVGYLPQLKAEAYQDGVRKGEVMAHPKNCKSNYDWAANSVLDDLEQNTDAIKAMCDIAYTDGAGMKECLMAAIVAFRKTHITKMV